MNDTQQIVDDLQRLFFAEGDQAPDLIERAHVAYVDAVEHVNGRLRECEELLHRGHRSEAIQLCEGPPNLLDEVATLDFPEVEAWVDYARQFDLAAPAYLMIDIASELNEAYSAELPLAELLKRHRLYALERRPLVPRIAILRKIALRDQDNPIWKTDLRAFEKARHVEVRHEINVAEREGALDVLAELDRELSESPWLESPPRSIVKRVADAHRRERIKSAKRELERMEPGLATIHAAGDVPEGRKLRECWRSLVTDAELDSDQVGGITAARFLEWLDVQDQEDQERTVFQSSVARLERAIDHGASQEELERLSQEATRTGLELPHPVEERLSEALDALKRRTLRRRLGVVLAITVSLVLAVGMGARIVDQQRLTVRVQTEAKTLRDLVDRQQLADAAKFVTQLEQGDPRVFEAAEILELRDTLDRAETAEFQRVRKLDEALRAADRNGLQVGTLAALKTSIKQLDRARTDLCRTDEDLSRVAAVQLKLNEQLQVTQQRVDKQYSEFLETVRSEMEVIGREDPHHLERINQLLEEAREPQKKVTPGASAALQSQLAGVVAQLERMIAVEIKYRERKRFLTEITEAVGNRQEFLNQVESFATQFGSTITASEMGRTAATEKSLWRAFETWDELVGAYLEKKNLTGMKIGDAKALIARLNAQLEEHGPYPAESNVAGLLSQLEALTHRVDSEGQQITTALNAPLNNPLVANLLMLQTKKGDRYYMNQPPRLAVGQWRFNAFTDLALTQRMPYAFKRSQIANPRKGQTIVWESPQSRFSDLALEKLDELTDGANWESIFTGLLVDLANDVRMEPFLKLQLMRPVLKIARQGSAPLATAFAKHAMLLQDELLNEVVNWVDPDDSEAQIVRKRAERLIKRLPDTRTAAESTRREAEKLKQFSGRRFRWVGWLHRDSVDKLKWHCPMSSRLRPKDDQAVELFVLVASSDDAQQGRFEQVGSLKSGTISLRPQLCVSGRPVYASPPEPTP